MHKRDRKLKIAGAVGLAGLLTIGVALINPVADKTQAAGEQDTCINQCGWDIDLKNYADTLGESSISISIGGANNEILNADKGIAQGMIKQTANVEFGATNGYTVKISGTPNLTGASTKATIPSAALTLGNMTNQWGWYAVNGVADCSESSVYKTMTTEGTQIDSGVLADGGTKTYTMCFGMRVNGNQAADIYNGSVTVSAVAEPGMVRTAPFSGITYMQDMTANICKLADENETAQLIDRRDNKKYWVTKLKDGNCWMSQNLDLDIITSGSGASMTSNVSTATSDITTDWTGGSEYPPQSTRDVISEGDGSYTGTNTWNLGDYVSINPTATTACASNNTGLSACSGQFMAVGSRTPSTDPNFYKNNGNKTYTATEYDAHYLTGNYYQWNAATAGSGGKIRTGSASASICPRGWKLPNSDSVAKNSFAYLLQQYGVNSSLNGISSVDNSAYDIALSPLFFTRSGYIDPNSSNRLIEAGQSGSYWSPQVNGGSFAYYLYFNGDNTRPSYSDNRYYAYSLRCLVPTP